MLAEILDTGKILYDHLKEQEFSPQPQVFSLTQSIDF